MAWKRVVESADAYNKGTGRSSGVYIENPPSIKRLSNGKEKGIRNLGIALRQGRLKTQGTTFDLDVKLDSENAKVAVMELMKLNAQAKYMYAGDGGISTADSEQSLYLETTLLLQNNVQTLQVLCKLPIKVEESYMKFKIIPTLPKEILE